MKIKNIPGRHIPIVTRRYLHNTFPESFSGVVSLCTCLSVFEANRDAMR